MARFRFTDRWEKLTPPWLRNKWSRKLGQVLAGGMDLARFGADEAVRATLLEWERADGQKGFPPDDAIPLHGRDRMIDPVDGESTASWRERLLNAWTFWSELSQHASLEEALRLYLKLPTSLHVYDYILASEGGHEFQSGSGGAGEDGDLGNASRLAIVIEQPHPWVRPVVGPDLVVGPGLMVGLTMTQTELARMRKYFQMFKPGNIHGTEAWIILDSESALALKSDHTATSEVVRLPLHAPLVGYLTCGAMVGPTCVVGKPFT